MNQLVRRYVEISKVEAQEDGTLKVYGVASSGAVDSDGERISPEAMKQALPDYMKFGAVREMHQPQAAGTAIEAQVDGEGKTQFAAHVVDPVAVKKVETKVYKGFSVGGKVLSRDEKDKTLITGIKLIEVSLVDRPANPDAVFTMYKADADEPKPADPPPPAAKESTAAENAAKIAKEDKEAIEQLGLILNKRTLSPKDMLAIALAAITKTTQPAPAPRAKIIPAKFKKGMGALSMFADLLQRIGWMTQDAECEAEWEEDNSPLPAKLREWLATGIQCFEEMTAEETAELLASLKKPIEILESAARVDATKAGAKFSQATKDALEEAHGHMTKCFGHAEKCVKACKEAADKPAGEIADHMAKCVGHAEKCFGAAKDACDKMASIGYKGEDEQKDDAAKPGDALKVAAATPPPPEDPLAKVTAKLGEAAALIEALTKRIKVLEDQPAPAKGITRPIAVTKTQDTPAGDDSPGMKPVMKADGTVDEAATLAKVIHRANPTIQIGARP